MNNEKNKLIENEKINVEEVLKDLDKYKPKRRGWHWREPYNESVGDFNYSEISKPLKKSRPLPAARGFNNIDPQPIQVITSEIASGRFEDDIRRMRMAAWHGADHIMVIRTAGQSHYDGLIEGTPEGIGGVPITRKEVRATRKALDMIEEEVGREINFHSYVSGVAGPDIAVMFAEEGVNGAHQDPQYNVLYRNINMVRSFVDAAVAKRIMAFADILQIDGAHNANATAMKGYNVLPELMVQHAINAKYSEMVGMKKENISLSTVPPTAPPAPCLKLDLPYAVALRKMFKDYKMRAQMNTKYMESCTREATVTHVLNMLISKLTSADIQSTITPDEGRNVPWHYNSIHAVNTAKQALLGMDGLKEMVELKDEGYLPNKVREITERAILFLEEIIEVGGYFKAVQEGFFVDSGMYPERNGDGIARKIQKGVAADTVVPRDKDYFAPVCAHFGYNHIPEKYNITKPCEAINGCTLCKHEKIQYIDELDPNDNVYKRMEKVKEDGTIKPEVEWSKDGIVTINMFIPEDERTSEAAALEIAKNMNLLDPEVIHKQILQDSEGTYVEVKGKVNFSINKNELKVPEKKQILSDETMREFVKEHPIRVVAATVGEDEHSVGLREIIDIKHGGIEKYGIDCVYLGTSCPVEKLIDAAIETKAQAILASTIITHNDVHVKNMQKLNNLCIEKGVRDNIILVSGGTQVTDEIAKANGMDVGFGRGSHGNDVASFIVETLQKKIRRIKRVIFMKFDYLIAEIGSTTTLVSALDFNSDEILVAQGKANTTVLQGDVTVGLKKAIDEIEESLGEKIVWNKMLATSSAAGGLRITVHGLVQDMTVKAAREAALGAGGIIKNVTAGKLYKSDLRKIKELKPNLIMIAGGTDYGERDTAIYNAEVINRENFGIPVIYCGNIANREDIKEIFQGKEIYIVDNVYPRIDELNVEPAREIIQRAFENNIVKAPGMDRIKEMVDGTIMPTPGAVMESAKLLYDSIGDVLVIDVGGATTDVHSVTEGSSEIQDILLSPEPKAKRTVEGDLGVYINSSNVIELLQEIEMEGLDREYIKNNIEPIPMTKEQKKCSSILAKKAVSTAVDRHVGYIKRVYGSGKKFIAFGKDLSKVKYIVGTGGALTRLTEGENMLKGIKYLKEDLTMYPREEAKILIDHMYIMACAGVLARENREYALKLMEKSLNL